MLTSHVTGRPARLGLAHQLDAGRARQAAQVHPRTGALDQLEDGEERDGLGRHRYAGQPQARGQRAAGGHALAEIAVLRAQPDRVAEGGRVLQRALQHLGVGERHLGLAEADAAGFGELGHLGQHLAREAARERAQRIDAGALELLGAQLQHPTRPGSSSAGSVSGGHTRLVTPPATAPPFRFRACPRVEPGSRSRAARSTSPGATMQPFASMVRSGLKRWRCSPIAAIAPILMRMSALCRSPRPGRSRGR